MIRRILPIAFIGLTLIANTGCKNEGSFKKAKAVQFKIVKDASGKNIQIDDIVEYQIVAKCDTYTLGNSWIQNGGKPAMAKMEETKERTDFRAVFPSLSAGDSAIVEIFCDSILNDIPESQRQGLPPWLKKGNKVVVNLSIISVKSKADFDKEQQAKSANQGATDDKMLQDYFAKNNLKPTKTSSGLYYSITKEGTGEQIQKGQTVTMNYTGKTLDGNTFDSNVDPKFSHVEPFNFVAGIGQVVPGWDEGVQLLKKGSKANFYIPSTLAYGERSPSPNMAPNSILTFEVEVVDVKSGATK
jgi:FKBP-type peptidyl-prolyl cis-trans isomerase FkpA